MCLDPQRSSKQGRYRPRDQELGTPGLAWAAGPDLPPSAGCLPQRLQSGWHCSRDHPARDQEDCSRHVRVERPVNAIAWFQTHLSQQFARHRDGSGLLYRVRAIEHIDGNIHPLTLEVS